MTEPSPARPVPGPPRPGPEAQDAQQPGGPDTGRPVDATSFDDLQDRPVAEHVAVFEDEHARLQRELGTIDQL
jgi:hypothetical protein